MSVDSRVDPTCRIIIRRVILVSVEHSWTARTVSCTDFLSTSENSLGASAPDVAKAPTMLAMPCGVAFATSDSAYLLSTSANNFGASTFDVAKAHTVLAYFRWY